MKTTITHNNKTKNKLDIRFVQMDSMNPNIISEIFSEENAEKIRRELHSKLGHLCHKINKDNGYINVYTLGNTVVGHPQFVDFSKEVWENINYPFDQIPIYKFEQQAGNTEDDYLDHENYDDI